MIQTKNNYTFGFTLIEMMIAVFIFSVVATLSYSGLNYILKGQSYLQTSSNQLKDLQLTFRYFEKDINQMINRSVRNQYQDLQPAFVGDEDKAFSFTHAGWRNPANLVRSKMQRVSYELDENTLKRYTWANWMVRSLKNSLKQICSRVSNQYSFDILIKRINGKPLGLLSIAANLKRLLVLINSL